MRNTLIQGTFGGTLEQVGPKRIEAEYPAMFITSLLMFPVVLWSLGAFAMVVGAIVEGQIGLLVPAAMGFTASAVFFGIARRRFRTMGNFALDAEAQTLLRLRGQKEIERWDFRQIQRVGRRVDPLHRSFERAYWLTVAVDDGRELRLGKGNEAELSATLQLLASWGLPVAF